MERDDDFGLSSRGARRGMFMLVSRPLAAVGAFSLVMNLLLLAPALFMLQVFDRVLASGSGETLAVLLVGVGVALLLSLALDQVRSRLQGIAGSMLGDMLAPLVARQTLAIAARGRRSATGESLRDVATVRALFSANALLALFDAPWAVIYVGVIWIAHPALGIGAALAALLMLGIALLNDRITRRGIEALQRSASGTQRFLEASMANAEAAEAMGMADALLARWQCMNRHVQLLQRPTARRSVAFAATTRMTRQAVQVGILALGAYLVITQAATPGIMVATTLLLGRALAPVEQIVASWRVLAEGRGALRRLRRLLDGIDADVERMRLPAPIGALDASGVVLRAPGGERLILNGVSLALAPGEALAVVGPSGAGKSSLVRVLTGLWQPIAGSVRLDGVDLCRWSRAELGPYIGYVPQDVGLFAGTIAENIARLGPVDSDAVVAAARAAGIHELILQQPDGYDTVIEPQGTLLSPGQRQRIALARALYGEPKLLLLDEPNSNLDGAGEQALEAVLAALRGRVTVVMVSHRSSLVRHADKMLVLDAGRVKHYGSAAEVSQALKAGSAQVVSIPRPFAEVAR